MKNSTNFRKRKSAKTQKLKIQLKTSIFLGVLALLLLLPTQVVKAQGTGTESDPFQIHTAGQLMSLATCVNTNTGSFYYSQVTDSFTIANPGANSVKIEANNASKYYYYKLMADIKLNPDTVDVSGCGGNSSNIRTIWTPIGYNGKSFRGQFDGNNHLISGVFVSSDIKGVGLFGSVTDGTVVKNLGLVNSYVKGTNENVGGIVGQMIGSSIVRHCFVDATIESSSHNMGGLVGYARNSIIDSCYAVGSITSTSDNVGGLCGRAEANSQIISCYSSAFINYKYTPAGALLGGGDATIEVNNCYYDSLMCGAYNSFGEGKSTEDMINPSWSGLGTSFSYSYSGSLDNYYPYLNGFDVDNIWVRFSTLPISFGAGQNASNVTSNFYVGGTSDGFVWTSSDERYVKQKAGTPNEMEVIKQGWSLLKVSKGGHTRSLAIFINKAPLIGTEKNPFPIDNIQDLKAFREGINSSDKFWYRHYEIPVCGKDIYFLQTNDIDISSEGSWSDSNRIGKSTSVSFAGIYDGGHNELQNMIVEGGEGGIFGYADYCTIKNLGVTIKSYNASDYSGAICSRPKNAIFDSCYVASANSAEMFISGSYCGALFGYASNFDTLIIRNCHNSCDMKISSVSRTGGIIGYTYGGAYLKVTDCYNTGNMSPADGQDGSVSIGGICGYVNGESTNRAEFVRCYNHGNISTKRTTDNSSGNQTTAISAGGICGMGSNGPVTTISYCYNTGDVTAYNSAAGISDFASTQDKVLIDHCYNAGNITVVYKGQSDMGSAFGIGRGCNVSTSLNLGNVTAEKTGNAYGISNKTCSNCFNAGTITSQLLYAYPINEEQGNRNVNVGKTRGPLNYIGSSNSSTTNSFNDAQMMPDGYASLSTIYSKLTSEMLGVALKGVLDTVDWFYSDGMYPRIKGLENTDVMIVAASPVMLESMDNVNAVTTNFRVGNCNSVDWYCNEGGFVTVGTCEGDTRSVTVNPAPVAGATVLTASRNGFKKEVVLNQKITCQDTLIVHDLAHLKSLRDGVKSGMAFNYDNNGSTVVVPAGAKGVTFLQDAKIDLSSEPNWEGIGTESSPFRGVYDGGGDTITGLTQNGQHLGGLFAFTNRAKIQNLTLDSVHVSGIKGYAGALITRSIRDTLYSCYVINGVVEGAADMVTSNFVGGLIGYSPKSVLYNCGNYASVTGYQLSRVGGLVGRAYDSDIYNCFNFGEIKGGYLVGGLVGLDARIHFSYNAGDVTGTSGVSSVGGIVGNLNSGYGSVDHSFNTGHVTATQVKSVPSMSEGVGGIVGRNVSNISNLITYCYNVGDVNGDNCKFTGGIVGWTKGRVNNCYVANSVTGKGQYVGAVVGRNEDKTRSDYKFNYYDQNICQVKGEDAGDLTERAEPRTTLALTNPDSTQLTEDHWAFATGYYPRIKSLANMDASLASAAMLNLGSQKSTSVTADFNIGGCNDGVTWGLESGNCIDFDNMDCLAHVNTNKGVVYAQASKNGVVYKDIQLFVGMSDSLPLFIKDKEQLINFRNLVNSKNAFYYNEHDTVYSATNDGDYTVIANQGENLFFKLLVNVDLSNQKPWTPIGNDTVSFKGNFDGDNHIISGLQLTDSGNYRGLFGCLDNGSIKNLNITSSKLSGIGRYNALLCGYNNGGSIINCNLSADTILAMGTSNNSRTWGGICGLNTSIIKKCTSIGDTIYSNQINIVAAICGESRNGLVDDCTVTDLKLKSGGQLAAGVVGKVFFNPVQNCKVINSTFDFAKQCSGGICGLDTVSDITNCEFTNSSIKASGASYIGGIAGWIWNNDDPQLGVNPNSIKVYVTSCISRGYAILSDKSYVGGIVGGCNGDNIVYFKRCANYTPVTGKGDVGGIGGKMSGSNVDSCYNAAPIESLSADNCGGLVGSLTGGNNGRIACSFNLGSVTGKGNYTGGIVGYISYSPIINCFNAGTVKGVNYTGGLAGREFRYTRFSYNAGQVYGSKFVGGIAGQKDKDNGGWSSFRNYNIGYVEGTSYTGAVYGNVRDELKPYVINNYYDKQFSFSKGINGVDVIGSAEGKMTSEMIGANLASQLYTTDSRWIFRTNHYPQVSYLNESPWSADASVTTTTPIFMPDNYTAWTIPVNIADGTVYGGGASENIKWTVIEGADHLDVNDTNGFKIKNVGIVEMAASTDSIYKRVRLILGNSENQPIEITNYTQLCNFRDFINTGEHFYYIPGPNSFTDIYSDGCIDIPAGGDGMYFMLKVSISMESYQNAWTPIGRNNTPFKGIFDGENHTISGVKNEGDSSFIGFFGYSTGTIKNLTIANATVRGYTYTGALCGYNRGVIDNCGALNGTVTGTNGYVGGLIGQNLNGSISYCYNANTVIQSGKNKNYTGGIVGLNSLGTTVCCFNMGRITSSEGLFVGGIAGYNNSTMRDCYNTGVVSGASVVGGIAGRNVYSTFNRLYNAGEVRSESPSAGGIAYVESPTYYPPTNSACDEKMSPGFGVVNGKDPNGQIKQTANMTGEALKDVLGTDNWTYGTDMQYPRLTGLCDSGATAAAVAASNASVAVVMFKGAQTVNDVRDTIANYYAADTVEWNYKPQTDMSVLDISNANSDGIILVANCGEISLTVASGTAPMIATREIDFIVKNDLTIEKYDTVCAAPYIWDENNYTYTTSGTFYDYRSISGGCTQYISLKLTIPDQPLTIEAVNEKHVSCNGYNDGKATPQVSGGFGTYQYLWTSTTYPDFRETTSSISGLKPGTYTLTLTDSICPKCTQSETFTIEEPAPLTFKDVFYDDSCYNSNDGKLSFFIKGGVLPYTLSWSGTQTGSSSWDSTRQFKMENLSDGTYNFEVTDDNGCPQSQNMVLAGDTTKYVIAAFGIDKPYDAIEVAPNTYTLTVGDGAAETLTSGQAKVLDNGDTLKVTLSTHGISSQKDACSMDNTINSVEVKRNGEDVTCRYNIVQIDSSVKINKLNVTLKSGTDSVDYNTRPYAVDSTHVTITEGYFISGEEPEYINWLVQEGVGRTQNTFECKFPDNVNPDNYNITYDPGMLMVTSSGSIIVEIVSASKYYDGDSLPCVINVSSLPDPTFTVNLTIAVTGSTSSTYQIDGLTNGTYIPSAINPLITNAGSDSLTITEVRIFENGNDITSDYADTQKVIYNGRLTVEPREITLISNPQNSRVLSREYDGTELFDHNVTVLGDASNDIFASQISDLTASAETPVINYTPTPVPNLISFTKKAEYIDDNYLITYDTGKLNITKRTVTYKGVSETKDYTGAEQCINEFYVDTLSEGTFKLVGGHTISTITYSVCGDTAGTYTDESFESFGVSATVTDAIGQPVTDNYNLVFISGTLTITPTYKPLVIKSLDLPTQYYDGDNHTYQRYEVTYDNTSIVTDITAKVFVLPNTNDTLTITPTGAGATGITHVAEGPVDNEFSYAITNAAGDDVTSNYASRQKITGTLSLNRREVRIKTLDSTKLKYDGTALRRDEYTVTEFNTAGTGFVTGEGIDIDIVTWNYMQNHPCVNAGIYQNKVDSVPLTTATQAGDYNIVYNYGTLTIIKAPVTVKAEPKSSYYGDTIQTLTYTMTGFVNNETEESLRNTEGRLRGYPVLSTSATDSSAVGSYPITVTMGDLYDTNYNFSLVNESYNVMYRPVTITANDVTADYTGYVHSYTEGPEPRYSCDNGGLRIGDTITAVTFGCTDPRMAGMASNAIYIIDVVIENAGGDTVTSNYNIQKNAGAFIIAKKDLKLKVNNGTIEYDGAAHAGDALTAPQYTIDAVDGLATPDTISALTFTGGGTTYSSDPYAVSIDTASLIITNIEVGMSRNMKDNYNITIDTGYVTITKNTKEITVASGSQSFDYDGTAHTFPSYTVTYNGLHVDSLATDSTKFVLPTGDTLTMTPTASITVAVAGGVENTFDVNLTNAASYANPVVHANGLLTMNTLPPISITSRDTVFTYDGQLHKFNRYIVVFDTDTLNPDNGTDTVFTIPANGHKVKITPTFAGITNVSEYSVHNNIYTYAVVDDMDVDAQNSYMAIYDTIGTVSIAPLTGVEVTVKEHGMETTYDGYEQRVHGYDVSINNSLYTESDFRYTGSEEDTIAKGRYKGVYPMNVQATDFVNDNTNFDGVVFTIEDSSLVIKVNPTVITLTAGSAEKLDDGTPLECTTFTYTPDNALTDVIAEGDSLVVELSGILYGVGETESEIVGYMVIRDTSRNATMVRKSISVPTGYVDVTDNYTIEVSPEKGKLAIYEALSLTVDSLSDPLCPGSDEGYVRLKVSGGKPATPKYNYQIVGNVTHDSYTGTSDSIITLSSLKADTYTVTVTESLDSMITTNFEIKERDVLTTANSIFKCPVDIDTVLKNGGCTLTLLDLGTPEFSTTTSIPMSEITIYNNAPEGNIFKAGETTVVTWVAKSLCGDSLTCEQNITVSFQVCPDAVDHEGTHYPSVRLGCKCWTTENLKSTEYSDGRAIDNVMDYYSPEHPNTTENVNIFGHLYDWYAAADTQRYGSVDSVENAYRLGQRIQGICPEGWYLPSDQDFEELNSYPTEDLRSTSHWLPINGVTNTNATGFNSLPGGMYNCSTGRYENMEGGSYYWTCHPVYDLSTGAMIDYICEKIVNKDYSRCSGFSIRCVYDEH